MDSRRNSSQLGIDGFAASFQRVNETTFCGHAFWRQSPLTRFVIEILMDGEPIAVVRAEQFEPQLYKEGLGDGCYGFAFVARKQQLAGHRVIEARIANLAVAIGQPIDLALDSYSSSSSNRSGLVEWIGGLRLIGTIDPRDQAEHSVIRVFDGAVMVAETQERRWLTGPQPIGGAASSHFDLHLPLHYADGQPHVFRVKNEQGQELDGSPLTIQAFNDGLRQYLQDNAIATGENLRAQWFDRFLPMSLPFQDYEEWERRFPPPPPSAVQHRPVRVILIGEQNAEAAASRLVTQVHRHWTAASVPSQDGIHFDWDDLRTALTADESEHDITFFVSSKAVLRADALSTLTDAMLGNDEALAVYGDLNVKNPNGTVEPLFFGAFDYERLLEQGYAGQFFAIQSDAIAIPEGETSGSLVRLLLALFDLGVVETRKRILHVPGAFAQINADELIATGSALKSATTAHLNKRGVAANVTPLKLGRFPTVYCQRKHNRDDIVSIVIPIRNRVDVLSPCLDSIRSATAQVKYEIIIVDNDSTDKKTLNYLDSCKKRGDRIVHAPGPFNYSYLNNRGVAEARGDFVCLLNNDTEIISSNWLEELLSRMVESDVGAVAPILLWPNKMVQNGGIVLGPNFAASDAFNHCMEGDAGYADLLCVAHESSAVSAACLLTWRHDYIAVGGFDELAFPVLFNDVDFCLRLRAAGKRILLTPHVKLTHHESATRRRDDSYDRSSRFRRELLQLRNRWGAVIANDPAYSPFLNLDPYPFSALAWPPRSMAPTWNRPFPRMEESGLLADPKLHD